MSPYFRSTLYPGLKHLGALISRARLLWWVWHHNSWLWYFVFSGRLSQWGWHCNSWFQDWRILCHFCVWSVIGTWGAMSGCGGNLDSICSGLGLFTRVGDIGSEEQRRALVWSWWHRITCPSCNFLKKDKASIPSKICLTNHLELLLKFWAKTLWPLWNIHILAVLSWWNFCTFSLAIWGLMVGADQFMLNTILPSKFSKLQTDEIWAIVTEKEIWKAVHGKTTP